MKFGLVLSPFYPVSLLEMGLEAADVCEADSLWIPDHLLGLFHPEVYAEIGWSEFIPDPDGFFDPFLLCAWAAKSTNRPLGVAVTDTVRRAAPDVARSALSLQQLCPGGFNLGIGCGEAENLLPFGYSFEKPVSRTEIFLPTLRRLLDTGELTGGSGRLGLPLASSVGPPKLWVAAHGPRMLRLAGEYGDGWLPEAIAAPIGSYGALRMTMVEHAARVGRPAPESGLCVYTLFGESTQAIHDLFRAHPMAKIIAAYVAPAALWAKAGVATPAAATRGYVDVIPHDLDPEELRAMAPRIPMELLEACIVMGTVDDVAERLGRFADEGCEHVVVCDLTGLAGGLDEAAKNQSAIPDLAAMVRQL